MASKEDRLKALEQKQAQITKQIQMLKAQDAALERKKDTRRKILIGGFILAQMRKNKIKPEELIYKSESFMDALDNHRDRALFNWTAKPESEGENQKEPDVRTTGTVEQATEEKLAQ